MNQKMWRMFGLLVLGATLAGFPAWGQVVGASREEPIGAEKGVEATIVRKAVSATVRIVTGNRDPQTNEFVGVATGSGVFVGPSGLVLTARHLICQNDGRGQVFGEIWCGVMSPDSPYMPPNRGFQLQLVREDRQLDLALLRIPTPGKNTFPWLKLGMGQDLSYGSVLKVAGFPEAGGATTTVVPTTVLGIDDQKGEIKVDGALMHGVSGGPAFNQKGELIGIALGVKKDTVPFFAEGTFGPVGTVTLGTVGYLRSPKAIEGFLREVSETTGNLGVNSLWSTPLLPGEVVDEATLKPIPGVVVVVLSPLSQPGTTTTQEALMAYAKSDFNGKLTFNRYLSPGRYRIKVVHPQYKTYDEFTEIAPSVKSVTIKLARE